MLTRFLRSLTESLEQTRGEKRKLEAVISSAQSQARTLEEDKSRLTQSLAVTQDDLARLSARPDNSVKVEKLESDLQDVRDQLADAEEELDDAKKREQKQRGQLLDELSLVQQEVRRSRFLLLGSALTPPAGVVAQNAASTGAAQEGQVRSPRCCCCTLLHSFHYHINYDTPSPCNLEYHRRTAFANKSRKNNLRKRVAGPSSLVPLLLLHLLSL